MSDAQTQPQDPPQDPPQDSPQDPPQGTEADWYVGLDADLQEDKSVINMRGKSINDVVRRMVSVQKLTGVPPDQLIRRPAADASPEDWAAVRVNLQGEQDYDGWSVPQDLGVEGFEASMLHEDVVTGFRDIGKELNLTVADMNALAKWQIGLAMTNQANAATALEGQTAAADLANRREFGEAHSDRMAAGEALLAKYGGAVDKDSKLTEAQTVLQAAGLDEHPAILAVFARVAGEFSETTLPGGGRDGVGGQPTMTPGEISQQLDALDKKIEATPSHDPGYQGLLAQRTALLKRKAAARK
ncbi:MAG: hypothetical protein AAGF20_00375 [Pseudomonadota bacterium]